MGTSVILKWYFIAVLNTTVGMTLPVPNGQFCLKAKSDMTEKAGWYYRKNPWLLRDGSGRVTFHCRLLNKRPVLGSELK